MRASFLLAAALVLTTVPVPARTEADDGRTYEQTFMVACEEEATASSCRCMLRRIEARISSAALAEEVDRHGKRVMTAKSLVPMIESAQRICAVPIAPG